MEIESSPFKDGPNYEPEEVKTTTIPCWNTSKG